MDGSPVKVGQLGTAVDQPAPVVPGLSHDVVVGQAEDVELWHGGQNIVDLLLLQLVVRKIQDRKLTKAGEMANHVVGEIQCRQGDQMFEALQLSELEGSFDIDTVSYSQTFNSVVVKVETLQFHQMVHS